MPAGTLTALHTACFDDPWNTRDFSEMLAQPEVWGFTACPDMMPLSTPLLSSPLAFILCRSMADEAEILTLATHPDARRRGMARRLVEVALEEARLRGCIALHLEVAAGNIAAIGLYASLGFSPSGRRKGYYRTKMGREDAILLRISCDSHSA